MKITRINRVKTISTIIAATTLLPLSLMPGLLKASTATAEFVVSATVQESCSVSASNITFGNYTSSDLAATGGISVNCTPGTAFSVGINAGSWPGATVTTRKMTGSAPGSSLNYSISQDPNHTANWGNTPGAGGDTQTGTGSKSFTTYGLIPAGQTLMPGTYTDNPLLVTVTY